MVLDRPILIKSNYLLDINCNRIRTLHTLYLETNIFGILDFSKQSKKQYLIF